MKKLVWIALCLYSVQLNAQIVNIPDTQFKQRLINLGVDSNGDGEIQVSEALAIDSLSLKNSVSNNLTGIEAFTNLEILDLSGSFGVVFDLSSNVALRKLNCSQCSLTSLDVSSNTQLTELLCFTNDISSIDISQNTALEEFRIDSNELSEINVDNNTNLKILRVRSNNIAQLDVRNLLSLESLRITENNMSVLLLGNKPALTQISASTNRFQSLDLSGCTELRDLTLDTNILTSIDLSNCTKVDEVDLDENLLTEIDFSQNKLLRRIFVSDNQIRTLDFSENVVLEDIICNDNPPLKSLFMKNGSIEERLVIRNNTNLDYICADLADLDLVATEANNDGLSPNINSFCSFTPGGDFYTIEGKNRFDPSGGDCSTVNDFIPAFIKYAINDGNKMGYAISDGSGNYSIPLQVGNYTIIPQIENASLFEITPDTILANFPMDPSPLVRDFCITPSGQTNDLALSFIPLGQALSGGSGKYKIIAENHGNTILSGEVIFNYPDNISFFTSANPGPTSSSPGVVQWSFQDLKPFGRIEYFVNLGLNGPMDNPPLNIGDSLEYQAKIYPTSNDINPLDNCADFTHEVVNSFDPNDKTCLEGEVISPAYIDDFVRYMIRFENNGNANAQNIAIIDSIDTDLFDLSTLQIIDGSHRMETRIRDNVVEFYFEDIQLPFDDANNDGYVVFRIKTASNLNVGDRISNRANIYFDFNFPIVTNDAISTFEVINSTIDPDYNQGLEVYPNPATSSLFINNPTSNPWVLRIYNTNGISKEIKHCKGEPLIHLNLNNYASGVYAGIGRYMDQVIVFSFLKI